MVATETVRYGFYHCVVSSLENTNGKYHVLKSSLFVTKGLDPTIYKHTHSELLFLLYKCLWLRPTEIERFFEFILSQHTVKSTAVNFYFCHGLNSAVRIFWVISEVIPVLPLQSISLLPSIHPSLPSTLLSFLPFLLLSFLPKYI